MAHVSRKQPSNCSKSHLMQLTLLAAFLFLEICVLRTFLVLETAAAPAAAATEAGNPSRSLTSAQAATLAAEKQVNRKVAQLSSSIANSSPTVTTNTTAGSALDSVEDDRMKNIEEELQKVVDDQLLAQGSTHERFYRTPLAPLPTTDYDLFYQFSVLYTALDVDARHLRPTGLAAPSLSYLMECMVPRQNTAGVGVVAQKVTQCLQSIRDYQSLASADSLSNSLCNRCVNAELSADDLEEGWRFCSLLKNDPLNLAYAALSDPRNWVSDPRAVPTSNDATNSSSGQTACEYSDSGSNCLFNALRFNSPTLAMIQQTLTLEERRSKASIHIDTGIRKYEPMTEAQLVLACAKPNADQLPSLCCGPSADRELCLRLLRSGNGFRVRYDIGQVSRFEVLLPNWYPLEMIQHAHSDPTPNVWKPDCSWNSFFGKSGVLKWAVRELVLVKDVREEITTFKNLAAEDAESSTQSQRATTQSNSGSASASSSSQKESASSSNQNVASVQVTTSPPGQWLIYGYGLQRLYAETQPELPDDDFSPNSDKPLQKSSKRFTPLNHKMQKWRESACSKRMRRTCRSTLAVLFPVLLQAQADRASFSSSDRSDVSLELDILHWLHQDEICNCAVCLAHKMIRLVHTRFKCPTMLDKFSVDTR